ncbi:MAG: Pyridoxal phosphate homeostasis protein [Chroococcopsis gigantea SAG 12.99]|jgi:pyridoxal phosphate enzyme (YggS family)|nr:YggS family pyridoxal phosphate-dependent enzyme [Chlorogloea purpurea SAG 13.99]MDV2999049.1 Pyridoxal phosphate homeostasis protein [Chroococcopsis gigantea SAG 12.99]
MTIAQRIEQIRASLPAGVRLIGVTKGVSPDAMREAYEAGVRDFGENRLQEALVKQEQLKDLEGVQWHFIGHLQANKAKKTLLTFQWIHAVDNLELAQRIDRLAGELNIHPRVLLQIKPLPDPQKYGWENENILADLPALQLCQHLKFQGLMTILPLGLSSAEKLSAFEKVRDLSIKMGKELNYPLRELSMGMSGDYLPAVQADSTMVRLGTIIFGDRS